MTQSEQQPRASATGVAASQALRARCRRAGAIGGLSLGVMTAAFAAPSASSREDKA
jgi:hypothetical protein